MPIKRVLFVCNHNSGRSQIAEAYLKALGGEEFEVESAGLTPGRLNPNVVRALAEDGLDISANSTDSVFDFFKEGKLFSHVITVCDESRAEQCPIFPGVTHRFHWSFADPSSFTGTEEEIMARTRELREEIKQQIRNWLDDPDSFSG